MIKKVLIAMTLMLIAQLGVMAQDIDTLTVRIKGMRCEECAHKVKNVVKKLPGIDGITFNIERRTASIAFDKNQVCADSIKGRLAATVRYKASAYSPTDADKLQNDIKAAGITITVPPTHECDEK